MTTSKPATVKPARKRTPNAAKTKTAQATAELNAKNAADATTQVTTTPDVAKVQEPIEAAVVAESPVVTEPKVESAPRITPFSPEFEVGVKLDTEVEKTTTPTKEEDLTVNVQPIPSLPEVEEPKVEEKQLAPGIRIVGNLTKGSAMNVGAVTVEGFLLNKYQLTEDKYPARLKQMLHTLNQYIQRMSAGVPVPKTIGAQQQVSFLRTVQGALDGTVSESKICFDTLLFVAHRNADKLFNARLGNRFFHLMPEQQQKLFTSIMTLVIETANPRKRATALKTLGYASIIKQLPKENQRQNLAAYYADQL